MRKLLSVLMLGAALSLCAGVSDLEGEYRNGQVFLRWQETELAPQTRLTVWSSSAPITAENLSEATKIASYLNLNSATDWWLNADSFFAKRSKPSRY